MLFELRGEELIFMSQLFHFRPEMYGLAGSEEDPDWLYLLFHSFYTSGTTPLLAGLGLGLFIWFPLARKNLFISAVEE